MARASPHGAYPERVARSTRCAATANPRWKRSCSLARQKLNLPPLFCVPIYLVVELLVVGIAADRNIGQIRSRAILETERPRYGTQTE